MEREGCFLQMLSDQSLQSTSEEGLRVSKRNLENSLGKELESMLIRGQCSKEIIGRERDLNAYRSGSAPPTVDGSMNAMRTLYGYSSDVEFPQINRSNINEGIVEEDIRLNPDYLSYYHAHQTMNPRLPPPLLSKEDRRQGQRLHVGNSSFVGVEDKRKKDLIADGNSKSLLSQPGLHLMEPGSGVGLGMRARSLADMQQEDLARQTSLSGCLPRPVSCNAFDTVVDPRSGCDSQHSLLCNGVKPPEVLYSRVTAPGLVRDQFPGSSIAHSSTSNVGSYLSRGTNPESQLIGRSPGHCFSQDGGRDGTTDKKNIVVSNAFNSFPSSMAESDLAASFSGLSMSENRYTVDDSRVHQELLQELDDQRKFLLDMLNSGDQSLLQHLANQSKAETVNMSTTYNDLAKNNGTSADLNVSKISFYERMNFPKRAANLHPGIHSIGSASLERSSVQYQNVEKPKSGSVLNGYLVNQRLNAMLNNSPSTGMISARTIEENNLNRRENQVGSGLRVRSDPLFIQNLRRTCSYSAHAMPSLSDSFLEGKDVGTSNADLVGFQKAYFAALLAQQKQQYNMSMLGKSGALNNGYYGSHTHTFGLGMPYPGAPMATSLLSSVGPGSPIWQNEQVSCFPSMLRNSTACSLGSWHLNNNGNGEESFPSSLLEEFKNNKARSFELSEIVNHVVEFSADQYGSRFIQQKLETATVEEKNKIFKEIMPHALGLMTDVFGNYVIQKFFEHGTGTQREELASQLTGHVLHLSLQMYGCRVIQKALEVVDADQQAQVVAELDGSVMKCIRDQNGNHVIQKCIECVPQDRIQFIISSFYGQVVALSTHPYGCRVIQRVLEHCDDVNTQHAIMEEILQSACTLAQDQYGNYVVQHVLQHGKPHERSTIIKELAGHIVKMSQQKFASNVVEKCLTFGGPKERQLLVNEMLGSTDENEPLQEMMKDPFANYVVQKLLETCNSESRELIISRIKVHLNALKRFTYGKHVVARVEKLINTEERRVGISSSYSF